MTLRKWIAVAVSAASGLALAAPLQAAGVAVAVAAVPPPVQRPYADFDGDGRSDLAVWKRDAGIWRFGTICKIDPQTSCGFSHGHLTESAHPAIPVPGDYDGDSRADPAVFDPEIGLWTIVPLEGGRRSDVWLGGPGDVPVPADYDGDQIIDPAVWRPSDGLWRWVNRAPERFGMQGDRPVPADYDGDGVADVAVWRPSDGIWYVRQSSGGYLYLHFGQFGDVPVPGDYDGDGRTDAAIFRPADGQWWILRSSDGTHYMVTWGQSGVQLAPADYDGDGRTDIAVYHHGKWDIANHPYTIRFGELDEEAVTAVR